MTNIKKTSIKFLAFFLSLCLMIGYSSSIIEAGISGSIIISINDLEYTITTKHVDDEGEALGINDDIDVVKGGNKTYEYGTPPTVADYVYVGYYVEGVGSLSDYIEDENPSVYVAKADAPNGYGAYTIYAIYSKDLNNNEIPDKDEKYVITEKFVDTTGSIIKSDDTKYITGVTYTGEAPAIAGYTYEGYFFQGTTANENTGHTGGSLGSYITGQPNILLQSISGEAAYDVTMVFSYDADKWATVTYDANGGTGSMDSQTVLKNTDVTLSNNAFSKAGYVFGGWSLTADGTSEYSDGQLVTITGDIVLYAVWEYDASQWATVTFVSNYKSSSIQDVTVTQNVIIGQATQLIANSFTNPGYAFSGWSASSTSSTVQYANGALITATGDITLYAIWNYDAGQWATITFNSNGGEGTMGVQEVIKGVATQLTENAFTKPGYAFGGWSTSSTATVPDYADEASITVYADTTLYAVWEKDANQWATITYHANGGSGTMAAEEVIIGQAARLTANAFTYAGYTFSGWSTSANGPFIYGDEAYIIPTGNIDLYALWTDDDAQWATITFNANAGDAEGTMSTQKVLKNEIDTLNANEFSRPGYAFMGWSTSATSGKINYADEALIKISGDITLYAVWVYDASQWATITFNTNYSSTNTALKDETLAQVVLKGKDVNLADNTFTNPGYAFIGWTTAAGGTTVEYADKALVNLDSDLALYAVWVYDESQWAAITFDSNNGTDEIATQKVIKNQVDTLALNTFEYPGYTFVAWSNSPTSGVISYADGALVRISGDITLYAIWKYDDSQWATITFDSNNGTGDAVVQDVEKGKDTNLTANTFTNPGYKFTGWSTLSNGDVVYADEAVINIDSNITLYAVWEYDEDQWAAITFIAKNGTDNTYTQKVLKNQATALSANEFTHDTDYTFLGWAIDNYDEEGNDGEVVYQDGDLITVTEDKTLYAVWGTAYLDYNWSELADNYSIGDIIDLELYIYSYDRANAASYHDSIMQIYLPNEVSYVENSLTITSSTGFVYAVTYTVEDNVITIYLGDINPGETLTISFQSSANADLAGEDIEYLFTLDGNV